MSVPDPASRYRLKGFLLHCPGCGGDRFVARAEPREGDLLGAEDEEPKVALFCTACGRAKSYLAAMVEPDASAPSGAARQRPPLI